MPPSATSISSASTDPTRTTASPPRRVPLTHLREHLELSEIELVIAEDALPRLADRVALERWAGALLVMDPNTRQAAGADVARELSQAGVDVHELVFEQREGLLA